MTVIKPKIKKQVETYSSINLTKSLNADSPKFHTFYPNVANVKLLHK